MQGYNKVLKKIVGGFLTVYLVMMGMFTLSKQLDVRREYRNYNYQVLYELMDEMKSIIEECDEEQDIIRELNLRLTRAVALTDEFQVYASAGVFKDKENIAKSGNYLENGGINNYLEEIPGGQKYIDLEKYLSPEELTIFIGRMTDIEEDKNKIYRIEVQGYSKGSEVIPEKLEYYIIEERKGEKGWHDEDAVLVQSYAFNVEGKEELETYNGDYWKYNGIIDRSALGKHSLTSSVQDYLQSLEERMFEWSQKEGWDWQEGFWKNTYATYQEIETTKGRYGLAFTLQFNPWGVAINKLTMVYIFSGIAVVLMTVILARGIWHIYKKQQLLEKNRREFVDAIAHELKTPLGIIQAYSEGLKEKIAEDKREQYLEVIIDETGKMNELILEMLDLSKLENKAYILKLETFSMQELIEDVMKNKLKLIEDKQIQTAIQIEDTYHITADYRCMEQVVGNLILNAIQHTELGGRIYISISDGKVEIENEGLPIPSEKLNLVWNAFYKVEEINNRTGKGSGVGLSIVRNVLELHHMPYGVMNTKSGVKFWFDINDNINCSDR